MSRSNGKKKETVAEVVASPISIRPIQFEWTVVAHVEQGGKIVRNDGVKDVIMEAGFNGATVASLVEKAKAAIEQKYSGGG